jgi:hypothetical protein
MGCKIVLLNYTYVHPEKIEFFEDDEPMYDIAVKDDNSFLIDGGYVVHNSAAGSAKMGRNRRFQAILPFRGKVINAEKHLINKIMDNREIQSLTASLGVTPTPQGHVPDADDLKYHKIVLMCFAGETQIPLLDGRVMTMEQLANGEAGEKFWVYSTDENGNFVPALGYNAHCSGETTDLVEVSFEDGTSLRCTPEHLFRVQPGTIGAIVKHNRWYKEAQYLTSEDSLVHIDRCIGKREYEKMKEVAACYNAHVANVKRIKLDQPIKVYDISVEGTHNFMLSNCGVIVSNSDADPDGSHICCLIMTFFYKYMRTLIERGHLYVSRPPLFRIKKRNDIIYLKNDDELERYRQTHDMSGTDLSRFKGLGEMNPQQLAETVLDPRTRDVVRVTIQDAEKASRTVEMLMGSDVDGRKDFLFNELALADGVI